MAVATAAARCCPIYPLDPIQIYPLRSVETPSPPAPQALLATGERDNIAVSSRCFFLLSSNPPLSLGTAVAIPFAALRVCRQMRVRFGCGCDVDGTEHLRYCAHGRARGWHRVCSCLWRGGHRRHGSRLLSRRLSCLLEALASLRLSLLWSKLNGLGGFRISSPYYLLLPSLLQLISLLGRSK